MEIFTEMNELELKIGILDNELKRIREEMLELSRNLSAIPVAKISELDSDVRKLNEEMRKIEYRMEEHRKESRREHELTSNKVDAMIKELSELKAQVSFITEVKSDVKTVKNDVVNLRIQFAKWIGAAGVIIVVVQTLVAYALKHIS